MPEPFKPASARATGRRLAKQAENTEPQPSGPPDLAEILASGAARVPVVGQYLSEVVNPPELGRGSELQGSEFESMLKKHVEQPEKETKSTTLQVPEPDEDQVQLYNASLLEYDPDGYLDPVVSGWIQEIASGAADPEMMDEITRPLVYMSDNLGWIKSIVGRKVGKRADQVTVDDIREHGRLNIMNVDKTDPIYQVGNYSEDGKVTNLEGDRIEFYESDLYDEGDVYSGEGRTTEMPVGPEPNDYISKDYVIVTKSLTGDDLIDFLRSKNALPEN